MSDRPKLSWQTWTVTDFLSFFSCPHQRELRLSESSPRGSTTSQHRGKAIHSGAQHNHAAKALTWRDLPKRDIVDYGVTQLKAAIGGEGVTMTDEEMSLGPSNVKASLTDEVANYLDCYAETVAPSILPATISTKDGQVVTMVETRIAIKDTAIGEISGQIDLCNTILLPGSKWEAGKPISLADVQGSSVVLSLDDIKSGRRRNQAAVDRDEQLSGYAASFLALTGMLPDLVALHVITPLKKNMDAMTITSKRTMDDVTAFLKRIEMAAKMVEAGIFPPAGPDAWKCTPAWCEFFGKGCEYTTKRLATRNEG